MWSILLETDKCVYSTRSQFNMCWVVMVYQVTIHKKKKKSKYPPPESMHAITVWLWTVELVKGYECLDKNYKCVNLMSLYFKCKLNALEVLSVPTDKILKDCVNRLLVCVSKTVVLWHTSAWVFILVLVWGSGFWNLSMQFRNMLYIFCVIKTLAYDCCKRGC